MNEDQFTTYALIRGFKGGYELMYTFPMSRDVLDDPIARRHAERQIRKSGESALADVLTEVDGLELISREWWRGRFRTDAAIREQIPVRLIGEEWESS